MNLTFRRLALLVSGVLLSFLGGCTEPKSSSEHHSDNLGATDYLVNNWSGGVAEAAALPTPEETFNTAMILGNRALQSSHQAKSLSDWQQSAGQWERALNLLRAIPSSSDYHEQAQDKIAEYEAQFRPIHEQLNRFRN